MHPRISPAAFDFFREPGTDHLSPMRFAKTFSLDMPSLAHLVGVNHAYLRRHPDAPDVQAELARYVVVFSALLDAMQDQDTARAAFYFRNAPLRAFGYRTRFKVVEARNDEGALGFVHSIAQGYVG